MPFSQGQLLFVLQDSSRVTSSRKSSLTTPITGSTAPVLAHALIVCSFTRDLPRELQCWLSHLHIPAPKEGLARSRQPSVIMKYEPSLAGGTHHCTQVPLNLSLGFKHPRSQPFCYESQPCLLPVATLGWHWKKGNGQRVRLVSTSPGQVGLPPPWPPR